MAVEFEAALHLIGKDDVGRMLEKIASQVLGLHGNVEKLNKSLKQITSGAIKIGAALGIADFIKDVTKANALLERQINIFRLAGNSAADTAALRSAAYRSAVEVRGIGVIEQVKLGRELSSALQDNPGARAVLPDFARAKAVIAFATGRDNDEDTTRLAKMIELRGGAINPVTDKIDPEMFRGELNAATKALVAGQGLITTNDLQQMVKQGGPAMKNFRGNPEAFWRDYLAAAEDMGGSRAGTAATAIARQYLGGIMTPKVANEFERMGMFNSGGWHREKGKVVIDDPGAAIKGYSELLHGGVKELVDKVIKPTLVSHGFNTPEKMNAELYNFASTETARRMLGLYLSNEAQISAVGVRYDKTMGGKEGFEKVVKGDLLYNANAVKEAVHTLATAMGDAAHVAPLFGTLADGINKLAQAASLHPALGSAITFGGGAAAAGLGIAGAIQVGRGIKSAMNGFGLPAAAGQLSGAAIALDAAAARLGGSAVAGGLGNIGTVGNVAKGASVLPFLGVAGFGIAAVGAGIYGLNTYAAARPKEHRGGAHAQAAFAAIDKAEAEKAARVFGPFRHWTEGTIAGRGRPSTPGRWDLGRDGEDAAKTIAKGFKAASADFSAAGKAGGKNVSDGFRTGGGFAAAGAAAAKQLVAGFMAGVGSGSIAVNMDGKKVGALVTKHQVAALEHPRSIGAMDSYGSHAGPGTDLPAWG